MNIFSATSLLNLLPYLLHTIVSVIRRPCRAGRTGTKPEELREAMPNSAQAQRYQPSAYF